MLNIFADQCVHRDLVEALREKGFKVTPAWEVKLSKATDDEIFIYAQKHKLALLTYDRDFGDRTQFEIGKSFGIVIVEIEKMSGEMIVKRTIIFFKKYNAENLRGKIFIVEPSRVRSFSEE